MKHAYLIMAHNEPYILEKLLQLIDDSRNDIYLHIDKKWKDFDFSYFKNLVKKSNLYFTKRLDVRWGSFRQIKCELLLFKEASNHGKYAYYHVLSGVDMPLANQNEIHNFFDKHQGKEFIAFDDFEKVSDSAFSRIKYYHFFINNRRSSNILVINLCSFLYNISIYLQKILKINRVKSTKIKIRKGANWISITDDLVHYILSKEDEIYKLFNYSLCADELFVQTIVYNSKFINKIISYNKDDTLAIKRCIDWKRGEPYTFKLNDFNELINSKCFFARKFSINVDRKIINKIYKYVKGE